MAYGLYLTSLKEDGTPIGICGLIKRETLEDVDIGFAFLPAFWGRGYAFEAAAAVLAHGRNDARPAADRGDHRARTIRARSGCSKRSA